MSEGKQRRDGLREEMEPRGPGKVLGFYSSVRGEQLVDFQQRDIHDMHMSE